MSVVVCATWCDSTVIFYEQGRLLTPPLRHNSDWRPEKAVFLPDLILKIAQITEVHQLRIIDVDHECWRVRADLGAVEHLQLPPCVGRMWVRVLCFVDNLIDLRCAQACQTFLLNA